MLRAASLFVFWRLAERSIDWLDERVNWLENSWVWLIPVYVTIPFLWIL
jgi:hypothetical protein